MIEVEHDFSGHIIPLALMLASPNAINIVKGTMTFITLSQSKSGAT